MGLHLRISSERSKKVQPRATKNCQVDKEVFFGDDLSSMQMSSRVKPYRSLADSRFLYALSCKCILLLMRAQSSVVMVLYCAARKIFIMERAQPTLVGATLFLCKEPDQLMKDAAEKLKSLQWMYLMKPMKPHSVYCIFVRAV